MLDFQALDFQLNAESGKIRLQLTTFVCQNQLFNRK